METNAAPQAIHAAVSETTHHATSTTLVAAGKVLGKSLVAKDAQLSGDHMQPDAGGKQVSYGIARVTSVRSSNLTSGYLPGKSQQVSSRINGEFYIYHENTHGDDSYLVVYQESGLVSIAGPDNPMLVNVGDKWDDSHAGRGFALYRMSTSVQPDKSGNGASWEASSPQTVNQQHQQTDSTTDSYSTSVTLNTKGEGSVTSTQSYTVGHSYTMTVTDWNIDETSDAATNKCQWLWYQNNPWSGRDHDGNNFASWWQDAYNMGGGWDDTKGFNQLSTTSLQYTASAAWRFGPGLISNGKLLVNFSGGVNCDFCLIAMPQLGNSGHHQFWGAGLVNPWSTQLDLVALAKLQ